MSNSRKGKRNYLDERSLKAIRIKEEGDDQFDWKTAVAKIEEEKEEEQVEKKAIG